MEPRTWHGLAAIAVGLIIVAAGFVVADEKGGRGDTSFSPVDQREPFEVVMKRMVAAKPEIASRHQKLLDERLNLANRPSKTIAMTRGKPVQVGPTARLRGGASFQTLAEMTPEQVREAGTFPYLPLPHPNHAEGGMIFPKSTIELLPRLERFDLDFDLPEHFLAEFPPAIFLTTRPDLGDVSQGKMVTVENVYDLFNGILNPKQLEGMRLLVSQFPQQQFNVTEDRRTVKPSLGVACLDCHVNGHTNGASHLVGDIRPQKFRRRIETPSLRGLPHQRLFGSQRAMRSVEDFTEFEQRAAYFDGDPVTATKKGVNILDRGSQVHFMGEVQALLDFPPAPKLDLFGRLDPTKATEAELRGEVLFHGKAKCASCHPAPFYTDGEMHDLKVERFYKTQELGGMIVTAQGPIKTFPLRGIKDSPPYLHDGRLLTLEDTVEFFNLVLQTKLTDAEKADLVAFLQAL